MALIECPDCQKKVSDRAPACPNCGAPIATANAGTSVQTVEQTAKRFKLHSLLASSIFAIGMFMMIVSSQSSTRTDDTWPALWLTTMLIGMSWYIINRIRMWWHHK